MPCNFALGTFNPPKPGRTEKTLGSNPGNKLIQYKECEGYGHIEVECANTKKNQSFLATCSGDESKDEEQISQPIALAAVTSILEPSTNCQEVPKDVAVDVRMLLVSNRVSQSS